MTTTLERAARALCEAMGEDWDNESSAWKSIHLSRARAVLMAVRDPGNLNDGMGDLCRAGFEAMFDAKFKDEYPMMSCGWEAMIDAILNEEKTND